MYNSIYDLNPTLLTQVHIYFLRELPVETDAESPDVNEATEDSLRELPLETEIEATEAAEGPEASEKD